jgi:hypothetical protein
MPTTFQPRLDVLPRPQARLWPELADVTADIGLRVAALIDLAGTKAAVVQKRAEARDYVDLDALMANGIDLAQALAAGKAIYGRGFNAQTTLKALTYFADGTLPSLPADVAAARRGRPAGGSRPLAGTDRLPHRRGVSDAGAVSASRARSGGAALRVVSRAG